VSDLFSDKDGQVAILLVDLEAQRHEAHDVDAQRHTPQHQLPVTQVVQVRLCLLQHLHKANRTNWYHKNNINDDDDDEDDD
jgi:hypothetical protein